MKIRITLLAAILIAPLVLATTVLAEEAQNNNEQTTQSTTQSTDGDKTDKTNKSEKTAEEKAKLHDRLEKRKSDAKLRLTTAQQKRFQTRCKGAQTLLRNVDKHNGTIKTNRHKLHTNLVDRLNKLETKLAAKGVDTAALKAQIAELQAKITTFDTDFDAYKQAVADLAEIDDCTSDPTAFKASLDTARTALQKVKDDAAAIRTYVKDTVKPTLSLIREELKSMSTEGN